MNQKKISKIVMVLAAATFAAALGNSAQAGNPNPTRLANISTRLRVETGDNVLIGGFIITGTQPKRIIVRAMGPSLTPWVVTGVVVDPVLELHRPDGSVVTNDNWKETQQAEIEATGLAPSSDLESAIVVTLPANSSLYTAVVHGKNNSTGVATVEVYDLDQAANSKLANISTRGFLQTGDNGMMGGTIVTGSAPTNVLVRAIGPSLTSAGVPHALQDPSLELRDGNGALLASNDNWRDTQEAEIMATGIPPLNNLESAILRSLPPGVYTAVVRGSNNSTGVALVEMYDLGGAPTPTPIPSATPNPSPTPNPSATPNPSPTPDPSPTPNPSPTANPSPTPSPTSTPGAGFTALSSRELVGTGDDVMVNAFIITGSDPKRVIVRGIGPSLTQLGIPNAMADPVLELRGSGGFVTITNNNWRDTQEAEIVASGLPPSNNLESAIIGTLAPGTYTVVLRGNNGGTGTGLDEVYDLATSTSRITAVGTRGNILVGDNAMVSSVNIQEGGSILLRVLGPSLSGVGLADTLQDPTLQLFDGFGNQLGFNDNWRSTQEAEIIATGIPPTNDLEPAIVIDLAPGMYGVVAAGVNGTHGIGCLQYYGLPHSGPVLPLTP